MWISDTSIKRPVFATMVIMSFMVLGIVSMTRLGIDLFPDVSFPFVNITVRYPGASPEEIETLVTKPIEDAVAGINGVKRVESNSTDSFSRVGEVQVDLDPGRLEALNVPIATVAEKLGADNLDLPGGQMTRGGQTIALRTKGEFATAEEVGRVILRSAAGSTVRVSDVGRVVD